MARGLLISASDTGAGKTVVAAAIVRALRRAGRDAVAYKPVESGCADPARPADGLALWEAGDGAAPLDAVCPLRLAAPIAPNLAARAEGARLTEAAIQAAHEALARAHEVVIVETAGGACSPLTDRWLAADLARELALPVLLVVPDRLGAIHQALAAHAGATACGARVVAVLLNTVDPAPDGTQAGNRAELERLRPGLRIAALGHLPAGDPQQAAAAVSAALGDLEGLLG